MGQEEYDELLNNQDGKCAICKYSWEENTENMCVDHDHETGKVRGLLCRSCNLKLGWFEKHKVGVLNYLGVDYEYWDKT